MVSDVFIGAMKTLMITSFPLFMVLLVVGVIIGVLQFFFRVQEVSLFIVPKILCLMLIVFLMGPWILSVLKTYTHNLWGDFGVYLR